MIFPIFFRKHLQEAKLISSIHKDTQPAKYARCLFKLSEVLHQVPDQDAEADQHLKEAEKLYFQNIVTTDIGRSKNNSHTQADRVKEEDFNAFIHISQR